MNNSFDTRKGFIHMDVSIFGMKKGLIYMGGVHSIWVKNEAYPYGTYNPYWTRKHFIHMGCTIHIFLRKRGIHIVGIINMAQEIGLSSWDIQPTRNQKRFQLYAMYNLFGMRKSFILFWMVQNSVVFLTESKCKKIGLFFLFLQSICIHL